MASFWKTRLWGLSWADLEDGKYEPPQASQFIVQILESEVTYSCRGEDQFPDLQSIQGDTSAGEPGLG